MRRRASITASLLLSLALSLLATGVALADGMTGPYPK
jgi:hypothetical protein